MLKLGTYHLTNPSYFSIFDDHISSHTNKYFKNIRTQKRSNNEKSN